MEFTHYMPSRINFGSGTLDQLGEMKLPGKKALVDISYCTAMKKQGYLDRVINSLHRNGAESVVSMILTVLATCLFSSPAFSGNYTVGVENIDYLPLYKGDGSVYTGYARELLDTFAAKYGHTFTYRPFPMVNLFDEFVVKKTLDFKFPDNAHWSGDMKKGVKIVYSSRLVTVTEGLFVLPSEKGKGLANITKIATLRGFSAWPYMDQIMSKKLEVIEVNYPGAAINIGAAGRVDGVFMGVMSANYVMSNVLRRAGVLVFDDSLPKMKADFSLSSISHPEIIKQMDEFLVKDKDTVAKLKAKHKIVE